jgi:hypothetical protein
VCAGGGVISWRFLWKRVQATAVTVHIAFTYPGYLCACYFVVFEAFVEIAVVLMLMLMFFMLEVLACFLG